MSGGQDQAEQAPSPIDFDSLVLDGHPFNTSGGFGDVYKAQHSQWGLLALKRPRGMGEPGSPNYRHLLHEAALWKAARHPNVLRFLGAWEANNTVYLVSPFLDDGTVMRYLVAHPDADRTKFILDIARGLSYLHDLDIIHGDIKGNNILITPAVDAVVADFGLAKLVDSSTVPSLKGAGSLRWQSPEVLRGDAHRTFKSDVYSFGMTIYEILSGTAPFDGINPFGVITKVTLSKERPEMEPKLSPSGLSYSMQWRVARFSWNDDPQLRPNMQAILRWFESEGVVRGRIRVYCERKPRFNGYVAQPDAVSEGCWVVTGDISKANILQCPSKGTFPRLMCEMAQPGSNLRLREPGGWPRTRGPVKVPESFYMSRELSEAVKKARERGETITPSPSRAEIWMMSHEGDLYSSETSLGNMLHPAVLTTLNPAPLVFCSNLVQTEDLPNVRMILEEIESDTLF